MLLNKCVQVLIHKHRMRSSNTRLMIVTSSLFVLITWHFIIDIVRLVVSVNTSEEVIGVAALYDDLRSIFSVMKTAVYVGITVVSDAFILYRCYAIWNGNIWVIILPVLLFLADIGTGIAATASLGLLNPGETFYVQHQTEITDAFFSTTLALNGICTGLIAFRIWWHQYSMREFDVRSSLSLNLGRISTIMIESGAIYSSTLIVMIATYASQKTLAFNIFLDITSPIIGIVFSLIIVRIGLGTSHETTAAMSTFLQRSTKPSQDHENTTAIKLTDLGVSERSGSTQHMQTSRFDEDNGEIAVEKVVSIVTDAP